MPIVRIVPALRLPPHIQWLDYKTENQKFVPGTILLIPFRGRNVPGMVLETVKKSNLPISKLKSLDDARVISCISEDNLAVFRLMSGYFHVPLPIFLHAFLPKVPVRASTISTSKHPGPKKTSPNRTVIRHTGDSEIFPLYLDMIQNALENSRQVVVLAPDISRLGELSSFFQKNDISTAIFHHGVATSKAWKNWNSFISNECGVLVTSKTGAFAPAPNLGLVIIDSEDDTDHTQHDAYPYYDARTILEERALQSGADITLASETPRFSSVYTAHKSKWQIVKPEKKERAAIVVQLDKEPYEFSRFRISGLLIDHIQSSIDKKLSVLCFLNRKTWAGGVSCADCGFWMQCSDCSLALRLDKSNQTMSCARCGAGSKLPEVCPKCTGANFKEKRPGIDNIENALSKKFPDTQILTLSSDTNLPEKLSKPSVIISTEVIWKRANLLIKNETFNLIAALEADLGLRSPTYRAVEHVWSQLEKLALLAEQNSATLLLQTWTSEHPATNAVRYGNPSPLLRAELSDRKHYDYPPFASIWQIFAPMRDVLNAEATIKKVFNSAQILQLETDSKRRAVSQHARFYVKIKETSREKISQRFDKFPNSWIIEPEPERFQ